MSPLTGRYRNTLCSIWNCSSIIAPLNVPRGVDEAEEGHPIRVFRVVAVVVPVPVAVIVAVPCPRTPPRLFVIMSASHALRSGCLPCGVAIRYLPAG